MRSFVIAIALLTAVQGEAEAACVVGSTIACTTDTGTCGTATCQRQCEVDPESGQRVCVTGPGACVEKADVCNGLDDNCNGTVDDGFGRACGTGPFSQVDCSSPVTSDYDLWTREIEDDHNASYPDRVAYERTLFVNPYVSELAVNLSSNTVSDPDDTIKLSLNTWGHIRTIGATSAPQWYTQSLPVSGDRGVKLRFDSDTSDSSGDGFEINSVRATCNASPSTTFVAGAPLLTRNEAFLMGTGDTLFFSFPAHASAVTTIVADIATPFGTLDADLYVRAAALPTKDNFQYRSARSGSQELITIPAGSSGQTYFMAVTSHSGSGIVSFWISRALLRSVAS